MKNFLKSGLYHDLDINDYHNDGALGSSSLKTLCSKTPLHLKGQQRRESAAFDFGSALHLALLEPSKSDKIICGPEDRRGNKWKDLKIEADAAKKLLLTSGDYDAVFAARDSVLSNNCCIDLLSGNVEAEVSLFHQDQETGLRCKIRPDLYNHDKNVIVDIKTCQSASEWAFSKAMADYGYHIQNAFYERVWNEFSGHEINGFFFLAIEKEPPYAVALYELDDESFMEGWEQVCAAMDLYKHCNDNNQWEGYSTEVKKIRLPNYAFKKTGIGSIVSE